MNSAVVLLSGGLDSVVSLALTRNNYDKVFALTFDYGQKSFKSEKRASCLISDYYNIQHKIIKLDWLKNISNSSLNTKAKVPDIAVEDLDNFEAAKKTADAVWIPNRNGLFVNIAACFAESLDCQFIIIGANKEESVTFKDNSLEFINSINNSLFASAAKKIQLTAPLIDKTKSEIIQDAIRLNVPFELIHSCYLSGKKHCGHCESCVRLKRALELNNRYDIVSKIFR